MSETKGEWVAYRDTITTDGCSIDVRHTGHEKTYTEVATVYHHQDARLIVTAINALKSINPDNPLAVAQAIKPMFDALKIAIPELQDSLGEWDEVNEPYAPKWAHLIKSAISHLESALAQAERKAE